MPLGKPIVTTVIRAYNRRDRIGDTIRSALNQTLTGQPIIVVDDASTDGTADAVRAEFGDRVTVIEHSENKGPGGAANTGLDAVETPFIAFLDSDDQWYPEFLQTLVAAFDSRPGLTMAYSDIRRSFSALNFDRAADCQAEDAVQNFLAGPAITMSAIVLRTRSARKVGFTDSLRIGEDYDFYVRLWLHAPDSFIHVRQALLEYDNWAGSITKDTDTFLQHVFHHVDKFLKEPAFAHLLEERASILSRRSFGVAANREVDKWLSNVPTRSCCIVVSGVDDDAALIETLTSIAAQRLPPREVIVLYKKAPTAPELTAPDWPFLVQVFPQGPRDNKARILRNALVMSSSSLVIMLDPGDRLTPTALDDHRRAFSSSFRTIAFSYGGTAKHPLPPPLPVGVAGVSHTAFLNDAPGLLSTMAMSRKALLKMGEIPDVPDNALWFALACQLSGNRKPSVRIKHPVLSHHSGAPANPEEKLIALAKVTECETGRHANGVYDELQDAARHA